MRAFQRAGFGRRTVAGVGNAADVGWTRRAHTAKDGGSANRRTGRGIAGTIVRDRCKWLFAPQGDHVAGDVLSLELARAGRSVATASRGTLSFAFTMSTSRARFAESRGEHDHQRCIAKALATAEKVCARQNKQLTPIRRRVLELIWNRHAPIRAYDILGGLKKSDGALAPPTVYRVLEFLLEAGLIHRIDALNAFIGCESPSDGHACQILVCSSCKRVQELDDPAIIEVLSQKAKAAGFTAAAQSVEIKGLCASCSKRKR
jgi:Fur family zinc uptake transcriptional regulator